MSDRLRQTPTLTTRDEIKSKGLVGEYIARIPQELQKISSSNVDCFLFKGYEGEKSGPVCLMDTTSLELNGQDFTGMKTTYQKFLPENGRYFYVPTTQGIRNNPEFVKDMVKESHIICFQGGEDPGDPFNTPQEYVASKDDKKNQPNPTRDAINRVMLDEALKHGHEKFFIGICRGSQLMFEENLENAPQGHRPGKNISYEEKNDIKKTEMIRAHNGEDVPEFHLGERVPVGCNHHLAAPSLPQRLVDGGWKIAYISAHANDKGKKTIEMAVRRNSKGIITGVMFQNHPEKSNVAVDEKGAIDEQLKETANKIYAGIRESIKVHQHEYGY
jgi:gamma-glutamyl-gamma-aminobutyrate hydrolase PuuD